MTDQWDQDTEKFEEWMKSSGIDLNDKVKLHDYRSQRQGRGLIALDNIKQGETLFSIPQSALIVPSNVPEIEKLVQDLDEWPQLICTMMYVCDKFWKPYFDVLPTRFNTPMFWTEQQLQLLAPSATVDKIGKDEADEMYKSLEGVFKDPLFAEVDTSEQTFHRMASLIMAYGFDVLKDAETEESTKAMVPPADMLNSHSRLCNARLEMPDQAGDALEMVATKDIEKGSQIYNFYGHLPNCDLLRRYGYVEANGNTSDVVEISLSSLMKAAGVTEAAVEKWEKYDVEEIIQESLDIGYLGIPDPETLAVANMLSENTPSKKLYRKCLEMSEDEKLNDKAKDILVTAIKERLAEYPETIEDFPQTIDEMYVDTETMCKQVISTEKELLEMCLGWLGDDSSKRRKTT